MKLILLILMILPVFSSSFEADTSKSKLTIAGTSTIHDWESIVDSYSVTGTLENGVITGLQVSVDANSIKSGKDIMDDKTYEALKATQFPQLAFKATTLDITGTTIQGMGKLTLAGKTNTISIKANIQENNPTNLLVGGQVSLKMSDYGIEPPTAMFGTLHTGDEVTISYTIYLKK